MIVYIRKADEFLAAIERLFLTIFCGALIIILMTQVILRYGFSRPLFWAEEISVQLLVFITLIGMSLLLKARGMISIDIIVGALPTKLKKGLFIVLQFLGLAVLIFFAYQSTLWILRPEVRMELSPTTGLPIWVNYSMLPITLYGMVFHMAAGLTTMIHQMFKAE